MEENIKKLISDSVNICIIPSQINEPESLVSALALFYTLKQLNKNVNLIIDEFPEKLNFLVPSLDFITSPKNFVMSIPKEVADISQIYYEKNENNLKIHLVTNKGRLKKEDISFYFADTNPDLVITLGIKDLQFELSNKLDSYGFILNAPVVNIDSSTSPTTSSSTLINMNENKKFGQINLIEKKSLSEIILNLIESIDENLIEKNISSCILAGLIIYYKNFKSSETNSKIFEIVANLIKHNADYHKINTEINKMTEKEINFLNNIFSELQKNSSFSINLNKGLRNNSYDGSFAVLSSDDFKNFGENEANFVVEKIKTMGLENDLLVLWPSHASLPTIKGFFYSKKQNLINRIFSINENTNNEMENFKTVVKNDWLFLSVPGEDANSTKEKIIKLLS